jgi:hypothetical protein
MQRPRVVKDGDVWRVEFVLGEVYMPFRLDSWWNALVFAVELHHFVTYCGLAIPLDC